MGKYTVYLKMHKIALDFYQKKHLKDYMYDNSHWIVNQARRYPHSTNTLCLPNYRYNYHSRSDFCTLDHSYHIVLKYWSHLDVFSYSIVQIHIHHQWENIHCKVLDQQSFHRQNCYGCRNMIFQSTEQIKVKAILNIMLVYEKQKL